MISEIRSRAPSSTTIAWTDQRLAELRRLYDERCSASQIAAELGGVSRNAVIGKLHRLGLKGRGQPRTSLSRAPRSRPPRGARLRVADAGPRLLDVFDLAEAQVDQADQDIPPDQRRELADLTGDTCRWPVGDPKAPDFFFCGGKPAASSCYCPRHLCASINPATLRSVRARFGRPGRGSLVAAG